MPTYDYRCLACGQVLEIVHAMSAEGPNACERCGGELQRVFHPAGIIFRGSGFYATDSRAATPSGGDAGLSSPTATTDSKPTPPASPSGSGD